MNGTIAHITHEGVRKHGGIGAVLAGMVTAPSYQREVSRTLFVGAFKGEPDPFAELERQAATWYDSASGLDKKGLAASFAPIESRYGVRIVYGERRFPKAAGAVPAKVELLLIDISRMPDEIANSTQAKLERKFGVGYSRFEVRSELEEWTRVAEPGLEALRALLGPDEMCALVSHEWFGVPMALCAIAARDRRLRTVFHAHEVASVRPIVESEAGHDARFYNAMFLAQGQRPRVYLEDAFGSQERRFKHHLIRNVHRMDRILAVGDSIQQEFAFLGPKFKAANISLAYNGVPSYKTTPAARESSRDKLLDYAERLTGKRPTFVFTHVARPVISKSFWRDAQALEAMDKQLAAADESVILFVVATARGVRNPDQVRQMQEHGWPMKHRRGKPDLAGDEVALWRVFDRFNRKNLSSRIVYYNQFGWSAERCGQPMPPDMTFADLRQGTDVEFGMSMYEPFGIAQLEPLSFGAVCVVSTVCGCTGFVTKIGLPIYENVLIADYVGLTPPPETLDQSLAVDARMTVKVERQAAKRIAASLGEMLPRSSQDRARLLQNGQKLAAKMSWEVVCRDYLLPGFAEVFAG